MGSFTEKLQPRRNGHPLTLPAEDATRFRGRDGTDAIRQAMVPYLKKDKKGFREHYEKIANDDACSIARFALITCLRNEILDVPVPKEQPNLKSPDAETISQAVLEFLEDQ